MSLPGNTFVHPKCFPCVHKFASFPFDFVNCYLANMQIKGSTIIFISNLRILLNSVHCVYKVLYIILLDTADLNLLRTRRTSELFDFRNT